MAIAFAYEDFNKVKKRKGSFKNTSKEERAKLIGNVICIRCGYQNAKYYAEKFGTCHLCGATIDSNYFKNKLLRMCKNG